MMDDPNAMLQHIQSLELPQLEQAFKECHQAILHHQGDQRDLLIYFGVLLRRYQCLPNTDSALDVQLAHMIYSTVAFVGDESKLKHVYSVVYTFVEVMAHNALVWDALFGMFTDQNQSASLTMMALMMDQQHLINEVVLQRLRPALVYYLSNLLAHLSQHQGDSLTINLFVWCLSHVLTYKISHQQFLQPQTYRLLMRLSTTDDLLHKSIMHIIMNMHDAVALISDPITHQHHQEFIEHFISGILHTYEVSGTAFFVHIYVYHIIQQGPLATSYIKLLIKVVKTTVQHTSIKLFTMILEGLLVCENSYYDLSDARNYVSYYEDLISGQSSDTLQAQLCKLFVALNTYVDGFTRKAVTYFAQPPQHNSPTRYWSAQEIHSQVVSQFHQGSLWVHSSNIKQIEVIYLLLCVAKPFVQSRECLRLLVEGTIRDSKLLVVQDQTLKVKIIFLIKAYLKSIVRDEDNYLEHFRYLLYCISEKHNPSCVCVAAVRVLTSLTKSKSCHKMFKIIIPQVLGELKFLISQVCDYEYFTALNNLARCHPDVVERICSPLIKQIEQRIVVEVQSKTSTQTLLKCLDVFNSLLEVFLGEDVMSEDFNIMNVVGLQTHMNDELLDIAATYLRLTKSTSNLEEIFSRVHTQSPQCPRCFNVYATILSHGYEVAYHHSFIINEIITTVTTTLDHLLQNQTFDNRDLLSSLSMVIKLLCEKHQEAYSPHALRIASSLILCLIGRDDESIIDTILFAWIHNQAELQGLNDKLATLDLGGSVKTNHQLQLYSLFLCHLFEQHYKVFNANPQMIEFKIFVNLIGKLHTLLLQKVNKKSKSLELKRERLLSFVETTSKPPKQKKIYKFALYDLNPFQQFFSLYKNLKYHSEQLHDAYMNSMTPSEKHQLSQILLYRSYLGALTFLKLNN